MASPYLKAAMNSAEDVLDRIEQTREELRIAMFGIGAATLGSLRNTQLLKRIA
jgi:isopentenyl diphosphate isomerase/L-lactate dehydrogenase-like FMN-dependent dehydrogenase